MLHPLAAQLTYEDAAEYAIEAIRLLGAPLALLDKVTKPPITINSYKAALPADLLNFKGVRLLKSKEDHGLPDIALRYATDIYHKGLNCSTEDNCSTTEYTYTVQNGVIFTSFEEGEIEISYKSLPVDDDGFPLIPNNQKTKLAIEYYVLYRFLEPLYDIGKITDKAFNRIEQNKCWYIGSANSSLLLQGPDHVESIMNSINRLIINDQAFKNFHKGAGERERLKRYK